MNTHPLQALHCLRRHSTITLLLLLSCVAACAKSVPEITSVDGPKGQPMQRFKVLTFNTLHGLESSGWTVKPSESQEAHKTRLALQFQQLARIQPEVMLLQEVNPLPEMAEAYVAALKETGLHYTQVHQVDACGVRLAPRVAVVQGLNNGIAVLAKAPLRLRKVEGVKLSGGFGGCGDFMGLQTGELRYALIAEIENPDTGRKLLAVSLHLHSGIERDAFFIQKINEAIEQGKVRREDLESIVSAMEQDQERRLGEVRVLVKEIQRLQAEGPYLDVIVGGDFNFEQDAPEYRELERAGLRDTYMVASHASEVYSLDPERNIIAGQGVRDVPSELRAAIKRLPETQQRRVLDGYQKGITQARRIDFLFLMRKSTEPIKGCLQQELFDEPTVASTQPGSDHYGILDTYIADPSLCEAKKEH